ncbi:MAG TPA: 1-(5-phosphoribosyl)-5-[(5-phosphoribosylamino)methylideneamino]imidazole-4-carboxamide isomerase [Candidatus Udaeobacter sp.]|nr:1-(5-phosphoribosyl)-5-[(5-phosphoribosylamino)methylideneamino]imidazole-4-carboxamide isomerase [Candidatus Udaeobacter sp.]
MILYPAIDLKEGACVRLRRGDMAAATVFNRDPAAQARRFAAAGAQWLHVVDLDGAFAGKSVNRSAVEAILAAVAIPCQLGGGIRDQAAIEGWLAAGVARVVLGTAALKDPELVREACRRHPGRIAVAIDARGGNVAVEGWAETSDVTTLDLAARFADAGVAAIVFTDVERDGIMEGANVAATARLTQATAIPVIASGGISGLGDLAALKAAGAAGAIVGRALYDGTLDLGQALAQC